MIFALLSIALTLLLIFVIVKYDQLRRKLEDREDKDYYRRLAVIEARRKLKEVQVNADVLLGEFQYIASMNHLVSKGYVFGELRVLTDDMLKALMHAEESFNRAIEEIEDAQGQTEKEY